MTTPLMTSPSKKTLKLKTFSVQAQRLVKSFEGLNNFITIGGRLVELKKDARNLDFTKNY